MSTNNTGNNTMSSATPAKTTTKRVAKKDGVSAPVVAEVSKPVAAPAPAPAKVSKKTPVAAAVTVAAPVVAAPVVAPVVSAPEAQPVAAVAEAVPQVSVAEEIDALVRRTTELREAATEQLRALQRLQKHVARELKEAGKRRRNKRKAEDGENVPKRPTIFTTPVPLRDELAALLGKPKGTQMTPAEVTKAVRTYIDTHNLKDKTNGHMIHPDANMRRVLSVSDGETLTYRNIQKYLYRLYDLKTAKAAVTTA